MERTDLLMLDVYPNPIGEELRFTYELLGNTGRTIELLDVHGRTVDRFELTPTSFPLEKRLALPSLPAGNYFLQVRGSHEILAKLIRT
jgi:hypothetical protein